MRMWVYIVRRAVLLFPVIVGVMTITFILLSALPLSDRLYPTFGPPPRGYKYGYQDPIPCSDITPNATGYCPNPLVQHDKEVLGLNKPVPVQWALYMVNALTFRWGFVSNQSGVLQGNGFEVLKGATVLQALGDFLPYTIELAIISLVIVLAIAIPLGNLSAVNRNRPIDQAARVISFSGFALPAFLLGGAAGTGIVILLIHFAGPTIHSPWCPGGEPALDEVFGSWPVASGSLHICYKTALSVNGYPIWMPAGSITHPTGFPTVDAVIHHQYWLALDTILRMLLPALVIAYGTIAGLLRFVRNSMLEVMNLDYVRTARAKGVPEKQVVSRHAGRNSLNVTITVLGLTFAFFIGGFPVIEDVFSLYGVGRLLTYAILPPLDYGLIFGSTLLFTYLVVFANLIVDVMYAVLDPRVRLG